jgi:hypothetical protein
MIGWLNSIDDDTQRISLNQASLKSGITPGVEVFHLLRVKT